MEYIDHTYKNRGMESKYRLTGVVTLSLVAILGDLRVLEKIYILKIVTCLAYAFELFMWEMHNQTVHFFIDALLVVQLCVCVCVVYFIVVVCLVSQTEYVLLTISTANFS